MEIRRIRPEEISLANRVQAVAFEQNLAELEKQCADQEALAVKFAGPQSTEEPALPSDAFPQRKCWGAFADDGTLTTILDVNTYTVAFDGTQQLLGGIGNVSTLPAYRHGGSVRGCMQAALREMYSSGYTFAYLYPFSHAYYRKFGFESAEDVREWTISLRAIPTTAVEGNIEQLFPGDHLHALTEVYQKATRNWNLCELRKHYSTELEKEDFISQKRYLYLWRDHSGEAQGFLLFRKTDGRVMNCCSGFFSLNDFVAATPKAYRALLNFVAKNFSSNYDSIRLLTPVDSPLQSLISEANKVSCRIYPNGMVRAVNVPNILRSCRCKGSGRLIISVQDSIIEKNSGTWELDFTEGQENKVCLTDATPDIRMDISDFSVLSCGIRSADDLMWMPNVCVENPEASFEAVFYRKPTYLKTLF